MNFIGENTQSTLCRPIIRNLYCIMCLRLQIMFGKSKVIFIAIYFGIYCYNCIFRKQQGDSLGNIEHLLESHNEIKPDCFLKRYLEVVNKDETNKNCLQRRKIEDRKEYDCDMTIYQKDYDTNKILDLFESYENEYEINMIKSLYLLEHKSKKLDL